MTPQNQQPGLTTAAVALLKNYIALGEALLTALEVEQAILPIIAQWVPGSCMRPTCRVKNRPSAERKLLDLWRGSRNANDDTRDPEADSQEQMALLRSPRMGDLIGWRVLCYLADHTEDVANHICAAFNLAAPVWDVPFHDCCSALDVRYWHTPKDSGYRACHIDIALNLAPITKDTDNVDEILFYRDACGAQKYYCEIQVKTVNDAAWGELQHHFVYKPGSGPISDTHHTFFRDLAPAYCLIDRTICSTCQS